MSLSEQQVKNVAHLARLALKDDECTDYAQKLSSILDYVAQMNDVNTSGIEPMAHPHAIAQPTRDDLITETDQREKMQSIAPLTQDGLYLVPKVIE